MTTLPFLLLAGLAAAQNSPRSPSVSELRDDFVEATDTATKEQALTALAKTAPTSSKDLRLLLDLFVRFPEMPVREAALSSIENANRNSPQLEPLVLTSSKSPTPRPSSSRSRQPCASGPRRPCPSSKRSPRAHSAPRTPRTSRFSPREKRLVDAV